MSRPRPSVLLAVLALVVVFAAACGGDGEEAPASSSPPASTTTSPTSAASSSSASSASSAPGTSPTTTTTSSSSSTTPRSAPQARALARAQARVLAEAREGAPVDRLPPSEGLTGVDIPGAGGLLVGSSSNELWVAEPISPSEGRIVFREPTFGVVQAAAFGDAGRGPRLYVVTGQGPAVRDAPLSLLEIDLAAGRSEELWSNQGERNQVAYLAVTDIDGDGADDLAFAYFETKYLVRPRHLTAHGEVVEGEALHMAMSRAHGDLDGDGMADEVIGRIYSDTVGGSGDLTVVTQAGRVPVPIEGGVRDVLVAQVGDDERPTLYASDGWRMNYGRDARSGVARVELVAGSPQSERIASSPHDYTFTDLHAADVDGDGRRELVALGNEGVSLIEQGTDGEWSHRRLMPLPARGSAVAPTADGHWHVWAPSSQGTVGAPID